MGQQTRKRKQKAGKFVGKGAYGCGFAPSLRCAGDTKPGEFSKLLESKEAAEEYATRTLLEPIDPTQIFFLYPLKLCKPSRDLDPLMNRNTTFKNLKKCNIVSIDNADARLIFYQNGGPDLSTIEKLPPQDYADFFVELSQTLQGLRLLHSNHICHLDIKRENLVVKPRGGSFHFRYIDFGFAINTAIPFVPKKVYNNNYYIWPSEMRHINKLTGDRIPDFNKIKAAVGTDANILREYLLQKVDVYSLGRLLFSILKNLIGLSISSENILFLTDNNVEFIPPVASLDWFMDLKFYILFPYIRLVKAMMDPSPFKRITAERAFFEYGLLRPQFRRLFTKENLQTHLSAVKPNLKRGFMNVVSGFMGARATAKVRPL